MTIKNTSTGEVCQIEILTVESGDFPILKKKRYFFDWKIEQKLEVYKLQIIGFNDILGLISLERIPEEWRIHIRLLTVSKENKEKSKIYEGITGNLIAHAARIAVAEYAELACVSLKPKSEIANHYITKYNMNITGLILSLEVPEILDLINLYNHGK